MSEVQHGAAVLVIFCRRPVMGIGKQRLANQIGSALAAEIAELLLAATLEDAASWPGPVVLAPAETNDAAWAATLLDRSLRVIPQAAGNLGERLQSVDRIVRTGRPGAVIYIGSDAPVLGESDYMAARTALVHHDVVLAPALDGGVTLMGARCPWPDLADLPWSSEQLYAALKERCTAHGLSVTSLASSYDVDTAADLPRLCADLRTDQRPARQELYRRLCGLGYSANRDSAAQRS
ncbi:MAG: glycosyltransferase [Gammaproteobacteria bacterium]|nr:glycosyltransferase [Gammaproteobacteria bacterium]MCP5140293.1 glycosyltransferase [Chromatiales bacterium]